MEPELVHQLQSKLALAPKASDYVFIKLKRTLEHVDIANSAVYSQIKPGSTVSPKYLQNRLVRRAYRLLNAIDEFDYPETHIRTLIERLPFCNPAGKVAYFHTKNPPQWLKGRLWKHHCSNPNLCPFCWHRRLQQCLLELLPHKGKSCLPFQFDFEAEAQEVSDRLHNLRRHLAYHLNEPGQLYKLPIRNLDQEAPLWSLGGILILNSSTGLNLERYFPSNAVRLPMKQCGVMKAARSYLGTRLFKLPEFLYGYGLEDLHSTLQFQRHFKYNNPLVFI